MDQSFDRVIFNQREKPLSTDWNLMQAQLYQTLRDAMRAGFLPHQSRADQIGSTSLIPVTGFMGDGFYVGPGGGMSININPGLGLIYDTSSALNPPAVTSGLGGISSLDDISPYYPVWLPLVLNIPITAPSGGNERYDIVEVALDRRLENPLSRSELNPTTGAFDATTLQKTLAYQMSGRFNTVNFNQNSVSGINYKTGQTAATGAGTVPATSPGFVKIAEIYVAGGTVAIDLTMLKDLRQVLAPNAGAHFAFAVTQTPGTPDAIAIAANPIIPAGVRVLARSLGASGGNLRVYILGGQSPLLGSGDGHAGGASEGLAVGAGSLVANFLADIYAASNNNFVARLSAPVVQNMSFAEQQALLAVTPTPFQVALGQPYISMDIARALLTGGTPTSWTYNIQGSFRYQ